MNILFENIFEYENYVWIKKYLNFITNNMENLLIKIIFMK